MKIFCVGRNYADHAKELGNTIDTEEPIIFLKPKSALLGKNVPFHYPSFTNELHYECETVLRICKNGKYIQEKDAYKYYDALSTGIDFTARDLQKELKNKGLPWEKSKAFDDSAVIGKWLELSPNKKLQDPFQFSLKKNNTITPEHLKAAILKNESLSFLIKELQQENVCLLKKKQSNQEKGTNKKTKKTQKYEEEDDSNLDFD